MAKLFSKCLGKIVLMTAAVLWAGCSDSEKNEDADSRVILCLFNYRM